MLHPYCRRFPPRARCAIDGWLGPGWRLLERHAVETAASPRVALDALAQLRLRELPTVRALFALRGLAFQPEMSLLEFFSTPPFVLLEEAPGAELVGGVLVPRRGPGGRAPVPRSRAEFERALPLAPLAAIATFRAEPSGSAAMLWTETWVRACGAVPGLVFSAYWLAIGPFSAWTRRVFLREARRRAEARAS